MKRTAVMNLTKAATAVAKVGYYGFVAPAIAALPSPVSTWAFEHFPKSLEPDKVKLLSGLEKAVVHTYTSSAVEFLVGSGFISYATFVGISGGTPPLAVTLGGTSVMADGNARALMSNLGRDLWSGFNLRPAGVIEGPLMAAYTIAKRTWEDNVRPYGHVPRNHHNGTG